MFTIPGTDDALHSFHVEAPRSPLGLLPGVAFDDGEVTWVGDIPRTHADGLVNLDAGLASLRNMAGPHEIPDLALIWHNVGDDRPARAVLYALGMEDVRAAVMMSTGQPWFVEHL